MSDKYAFILGHETSTPLKGRENLHPLILPLESPIQGDQPYGMILEMDNETTFAERYLL